MQNYTPSGVELEFSQVLLLSTRMVIQHNSYRVLVKDKAEKAPHIALRGAVGRLGHCLVRTTNNSSIEHQLSRESALLSESSEMFKVLVHVYRN